MARSIYLFWILEGLEPLTSLDRSCGVRFGSLGKAVQEACRSEAEWKAKKHLPWIRAGSGQGAAVFNRQAILLLRDIYNEGAKHSCGASLP